MRRDRRVLHAGALDQAHEAGRRGECRSAPSSSRVVGRGVFSTTLGAKYPTAPAEIVALREAARRSETTGTVATAVRDDRAVPDLRGCHGPRADRGLVYCTPEPNAGAIESACVAPAPVAQLAWPRPYECWKQNAGPSSRILQESRWASCELRSISGDRVIGDV